MPKICPYCKRPSDDAAHFCSGCGQPLNNVYYNYQTYSEQPETAHELKPKQPGAGLGVASMVLGIIGAVYTFPCFFLLISIFLGTRYSDIQLIITAACMLVLPVLSFIFGAVSALKGCKKGQTLTGLTLSTISLIICLSTVCTMIVDLI